MVWCRLMWFVVWEPCRPCLLWCISLQHIGGWWRRNVCLFAKSMYYSIIIWDIYVQPHCVLRYPCTTHSILWHVHAPKKNLSSSFPPVFMPTYDLRCQGLARRSKERVNPAVKTQWIFPWYFAQGVLGGSEPMSVFYRRVLFRISLFCLIQRRRRDEEDSPYSLVLCTSALGFDKLCLGPCQNTYRNYVKGAVQTHCCSVH